MIRWFISEVIEDVYAEDGSKSWRPKVCRLATEKVEQLDKAGKSTGFATVYKEVHPMLGWSAAYDSPNPPIGKQVLQ